MSEQAVPIMARARGRILVDVINIAFAEVIAACLAALTRRAERTVRATLNDFSAEHLAAHGWSQRDIERLKSI